MHLRRYRTRIHAFTFVELCIGLSITTVVMGALASFMMALSGTWQNAEKTQAVVLASTQANTRINQLFKGSKGLGGWTQGSMSGKTAASVVLWYRDGEPSMNAAPDGRIQYGEIALIQYNSGTRTLDIYKSANTGSLGAEWAYSLLCAPDFPTLFKTGLTPQPIARNVAGVEFEIVHADNPNAYPSLKYKIAFDRSGQISVQEGITSMRAPGVPPQ